MVGASEGFHSISGKEGPCYYREEGSRKFPLHRGCLLPWTFFLAALASLWTSRTGIVAQCRNYCTDACPGPNLGGKVVCRWDGRHASGTMDSGRAGLQHGSRRSSSVGARHELPNFRSTTAAPFRLPDFPLLVTRLGNIFLGPLFPTPRPLVFRFLGMSGIR
ncbi:hypothetical protein VUR80DRAFT_8923 [Thermomyces stellatus]